MSPLNGQKKLARMVGCEYGLAMGNATTGLYCTMQAAGLHGVGIAVPYNVCPNVVLAVLFSGNTPVFVDIEEETNGLNPSRLRELAKKVKGVIAVHAYGAACKIKKIRDVCSEHSLLLIEDCAQSLGAESNGSPVGCHGAVSVFSFGKGKIVDVGHGGIAVTGDAHLFKEMQQVAGRLDHAGDEKRERMAEFNDLHTMFYNRFWGHDISRFSFVFQALAWECKDAFLQKFDSRYDEVILNALAHLPKNIEGRRQKAEFYTSYCKSHGIPFFDPPPGSVFWRFNVYIKEGRDRLFRTLLSEKIRVSSWYPSIDQFFYKTGDVKSRRLCADRIGEEILNLWVNEEVSETYCREIMERIGGFVEQSRLGALAVSSDEAWH
jgi:dTDP-4-amino-4,6-dideoxygalactose transaminase